MMDWTDRHCRFFHRQVSRHAVLYTEMVTTGALIHGDVARHLDYSDEEHPLALQVGGSEPDDLAHAARLAARWGYQEINLNCGCPSERVQRGAFGACLMNEPDLVSDCVKAMVDACDLPVTVKHRIGLGKDESYPMVRDFVGRVAEGGCKTFIVHARNAWLEGLSPKENREIPPLRYDVVYQLKRDFEGLEIVLNGGVDTLEQAADHLRHVDGVMIGRRAYHDPYVLSAVDGLIYADPSATPVSRAEVAARMAAYVARFPEGLERTRAFRAVARHMLGLYQGIPGARSFRRMLSDSDRLASADGQLLIDATAKIEARADAQALLAAA